jgi:hypothetical protein
MIIDKADLTERNQRWLILSDNVTLSLGQECVRNTLFAYRLLIYDLSWHLVALDYVLFEGHHLGLKRLCLGLPNIVVDKVLDRFGPFHFYIFLSGLLG